MDEEKFQLINERLKTKLKLRNSKVRLFVYAVLEFNGKYLPASFLLVNGKTDSGPFLGCDTAVDIGVLKIVNKVTAKENRTPEPKLER